MNNEQSEKLSKADVQQDEDDNSVKRPPASDTIDEEKQANIRYE